MRDILEKYEQRKLELFETLYFCEDWMTIPTLAKKLLCSERTVKQDITSLKESLPDEYLQTSHRGIRLFLPTHISIEMIYRSVLKESANFNLLESLFHDETKTLEEMADFLYTSPTTLIRAIKKINLALNDYSLQIQTNPCQLIGPEANIRSFYICYFMESYTHFEWPYPTIDQKVFDNFLILAAKFVHFQWNFSDFERVKHWIAVSLIRTQKGHYVEIKQNDLTKYIPDLSKFHFILKPLEKKMNISFRPQFIEQVFAVFLNNSYVFTYDQLIKESETDPELKKSVDLLSGLLDTLSKQVGIPIPNKEHLLLDLYNLTKMVSRPNNHIRKVTYILFDQKEFFVHSLEEDIPDFVRLAKKQINTYKKKMDLIFSKHSVDELVYTLIIHWENLFIELHKQRKKAKVLIISTYDLEHAQLIRDVIDIHYHDNVTSEIYLEPRLSLKQLKKMEYDVLITTTSFEPIQDKKIICIQNIPTEKNLREIKLAIDEVRKSGQLLRS
ncbi:M protein trans-acting positive regulator PRD domain-containing protein [Carnobacterium sp.]|uniref:M protein trans-acting positive regulator PRD domain-containing protein n=1 Tax=Carnobacterium sp. TaxID=48221 RepID=UPI0028AF502C|nr:M protein trans-acting positive regulator PRD domain-containing protein [Carnobacterium sp.]